MFQWVVFELWKEFERPCSALIQANVGTAIWYRTMWMSCFLSCDHNHCCRVIWRVSIVFYVVFKFAVAWLISQISVPCPHTYWYMYMTSTHLLIWPSHVTPCTSSGCLTTAIMTWNNFTSLQSQMEPKQCHTRYWRIEETNSSETCFTYT